MCVCVCVCVCVSVCVHEWLNVISPTAFPLVHRYLAVLQDYAMHLCLTTSRADGAKPQDHTHLMGHPLHQSAAGSEGSSCRLYHSHSVLSAILSARQLVTNAASGGKKQNTPLSATRPPQVELSKQDNSGEVGDDDVIMVMVRVVM